MVSVVLAAVFIRPLISGSAYKWSNSIIQVILTFVFAALILRVINSREKFYQGASCGIALTAFILWTGVSAVFSVFFADSLRELYNLYGYALCFFIAVNIFRGAKRKELLLNALIISFFIVSLFSRRDSP